MDELVKLEAELESALEEVRSFNDTPNKSKSKRIRLQLGEIKKKVTAIRAILVEADKAGY